MLAIDLVYTTGSCCQQESSTGSVRLAIATQIWRKSGGRRLQEIGGVARGLGQYLGYTKRGKTRRLAKRVSGGRKNDKTFTECRFSELRRGGDDQKIRAERKSALLIRKLRLVHQWGDGNLAKFDRTVVTLESDAAWLAFI